MLRYAIADRGPAFDAPAVAAWRRHVARGVDAHADRQPRERDAGHDQGNVQILPNGNVVVGWGSQPYVSEFTAAGELLFDARLGSGLMSYRAFRLPWTSAANGIPAVATTHTLTNTTVYISWNGDTRVTQWTALAGTSPDALAQVATAARTGFETSISIAAALTYVQVRGSDVTGAALATTAVIAI